MPPAMRTQATTFFTGARHARRALDTLAGVATPRAFVVGPAGSGKSTLLNQLEELLHHRGIAHRRWEGSADPAQVPPSEVLLVDDLHLRDAAQVEAIQLRAADPDAALVVASRPWPRSTGMTEISRALDRSSPPLILGQVSRSDVLTYLEERGQAFSSACLDRLLAVTGGVSWLVSHALSSHDGRDCVDDDDHLEMRRALEARIAHRLDTLDEPLRRTVERLSREDHAWQEATAEELIAQGYAEGLLLRNGSLVPVVRSAARAALPARPARSAVALEQALAAWAAGDLDVTASLVDAALADETQAGHDGVADTAAAVWAARGMLATGSDVYAARPVRGDAAAVRAAIAHLGAGMAERLDTPTEPADAAGAPPGRRDPAPSTLGIALRLLDRGLRDSLKQDPPPSTLSHLVRASDLYSAAHATDPLPELPAVIAAAVAVGGGDLATARHVLDAAVAAGQGGPWALRRLLLWRSWVSIQSERPAQARAVLAQAEEVPSPRSPRDELLRQTVLVTLSRRYEDLPSLERTWGAAREGVRHLDIDLYTLLPLSALLCAAARVGDATTLVPHVTHGLDLLRRLGSPPLWSAHLRWAGVQQGILLNRPDSLGPHARALVAAAPHSHVAATMAQAGGVWVAVLGGSVDADAVETAARALASIGLAWDGARLAGHGAGRTQDRRAAARLLSCARELHPPEAARATSTGTAPHGGSPGGESARVPGAAKAGLTLSEREVDVARLVLQGKTYAEIGETIFISPRTVEHHIAHIRRRLDATSRSDLLAKLRVAIESSAGALP